MCNISGRRWNQLICAVNCDIPKEKVNPPIISDYESNIYDNMVKQLKEIRKIDPEAIFSATMELDDEEILDIYNDSTIKK